MLKAIIMMLVIALSTTMLQAQPPVVVDQTNPTAVATAYMVACQNADVEGALALVVPAPEVLTAITVFAQSMNSEQEMGGAGIKGFLQEIALLPVGLVDAPGAVTVEEGAELTVSFAGTPALARKIVLAQGDDGLWRVDLRKSIAATTNREQSVLLAQVEQIGQGGQGPRSGGSEEWRAQRKISTAAQTVLEYAREHGNKIPDAAVWTDQVSTWALDNSVLRRPGFKAGECGYALNIMLVGQPVPDWPLAQSTVVLFEVDDPAPNLVGDPDADRVDKLLDGRVPWVAFADGQTTQGVSGEIIATRVQSRQDEEICQQHLSTLGRALRQYAREHDGKLPAADSWSDEIGPYLEPAQTDASIWTCPACPDLPFAYAINEALVGVDVRTLTGHQQRILLVHGIRGERNEAVEVGTTAPLDTPHQMNWEMSDERPNLDIYCTLSGNIERVPAGSPYPAEMLDEK